MQHALGLIICGFTDQHHFMLGIGADYFQAERSLRNDAPFGRSCIPNLWGRASMCGVEKICLSKPFSWVSICEVKRESLKRHAG